jgi:hypothetical protein
MVRINSNIQLTSSGTLLMNWAGYGHLTSSSIFYQPSTISVSNGILPQALQKEENKIP